ncbi:2'-5' RNA ligase family protein [Oscillatoria sp. FACHB-1406]|uniref:2'-5' RNA ligase family protein n=1 Tax=Oscillatoria sp. FACHB-1406 TaxID=2692846 RepID=UPI001689065A|nr:2'-5' RNA ligase family protein [Oscillatoria sp. FACHB-1406]MBD2578742.1 2'-5' RNA ligase family protein [Oscillatoria sp. FACHB-1406]
MLQRFFIAILPPEPLRQEIDEIKQYFARVYESSAALKSPPHITLKPPFQWEIENIPPLEDTLQEFAALYSKFSLAISGFGAFKPRVIFLHPLPNSELLNIQQALVLHLSQKLALNDRETRPFAPHLTVAFRDLTPASFKLAWSELKDRAIEFQFEVSALTLLIHTGKRWEIHREFPLQLRAK